MTATEALALLKANPPHEESPLPWRLAGRRLVDANDEDIGAPSCEQDGKCIAATVNVAPVLAAEVERSNAELAAQTATVEAARAILLTLCGQSPACGDSVETLARRVAGEFEAARVAVEDSWRMAQEKLDWRDHYWGRNCSVSEANPCCDSESYNDNLMALRRKLDEARRALGLEESHG